MNQNLLLKYISGKASQREKEEVAAWIDADAANLKEFMSLRKSYDALVWQDADELKTGRDKLLSLRTFTMKAMRIAAIDNGIYIAEAAPSNTFGQQIEAQLVDEGDVIKTLTVRLVRAIDQDVTVTLDIDQQLIDEYNQQHEASYELLPEEFRSFERTVTIPAGEVSAPVINLTIKPFTTPNNEAYAIPVRITSVTGPIGLVGNANHILYLLTSPNKQKAVILKSGNKTSLKFKNEIPVTQWTIEYWIRFDNITGRPTGNWVGLANKPFREMMFPGNVAPLSFNGILLRYWPQGVKQIAPVLQCQLDGNYFDSEEFWWPDTWYHITYTYDGSTIRLYKDGTINASKTDSRDFTFNTIS